MSTPSIAEGEWVNPPPSLEDRGGSLIVTTGPQSDFWRHTAYGFVHNSGHALLQPLPESRALELSISGRFDHDFDQAGIMVWADEEHWIKCGVEYSDGVLGLGAVVTAGSSDWSTSPVPDWDDKKIFLRVSRHGDAVTIRARTSESRWQLVRLAPIDPRRQWRAGPHAASPSRAGLEVTFSDYRVGPSDESIH